MNATRTVILIFVTSRIILNRLTESSFTKDFVSALPVLKKFLLIFKTLVLIVVLILFF